MPAAMEVEVRVAVEKEEWEEVGSAGKVRQEEGVESCPFPAVLKRNWRKSNKKTSFRRRPKTHLDLASRRKRHRSNTSSMFRRKQKMHF